MRRDRTLGALVAILGFGTAALLLVLVHVTGQVNANHAQLHQQDDVIRQLSGAVAAAQQDASTQRRLVQALQRQVRSLGGKPLTAPPTPLPAPESQGSSPGPAATPSATPRPSPTTTRPPSPRPTPSPSPHPSPSPSSRSLCVPNVVCVTPGGR